jgi:hypothetical protein
MMQNPSLREEPRNQRAGVIPTQRGTSILDWLEENGRLLARDGQEFDYGDDEEEIEALMGTDDSSYEDDLDDSDPDE